MGAGVGQADQTCVMTQKPLDRRLVRIEQGGVEDGLELFLDGEVEQDVDRVSALAPGDGGDGLALERPVLGRVRHRDLDPPPVAVEELAALRPVQIGAEPVPEPLAPDGREEILVGYTVQRPPRIKALERKGRAHREIHAERLARDLGPDRVAPALSDGRGFEHADGPLREGIVVKRRGHEDRPASLGGQRLEPRDRHARPDGELENAAAEFAQHADQSTHLGLVGEPRGHRYPAVAIVVEGGRGGEADRAGFQRLLHQRAHAATLVPGRRALRGFGAQHGGAHRRVADENAGVRIAALAAEQREIVRESLEAPIDPRFQGHDRHALDLGEIARDLLAPVGRAGRDAEAAIAHHDGGHAERGRGRRPALPGELRIIMGVNVDDARRQHEAVGLPPFRAPPPPRRRRRRSAHR